MKQTDTLASRGPESPTDPLKVARGEPDVAGGLQPPELLRRYADLYPELRRLAHAKLKREDTFTLLDTTSLVHDAFLRLAGSRGLTAVERPAFWSYASQVMRSVIVDHARARLAQRRGARAEHVALDTGWAERLAEPENHVIEVHAALRVLEQAEPRLAQVVEMQYFGGMTDREIAEALGIAERTVRRDWEKARRLLQVALS